MNFSLGTFGTILCAASVASAASSGPRFYGDAPDEHHPWAVHDGNRPQPRVVTPGTFSTQDTPGKPPADAVVLFDGSDLSKWESGKGEAAKWLIKDGYMEAKPGGGDIRTKEKFGDCQLHVEWAAPKEIKGDSQGRGNSGIFLMGLVEIQVLDTYNNPTYADGHAASVYCVNPPMVSALRPPGEFQVYDIVFRRPVYKDGQCLSPGYVTVFVNGVVVQDATPLEGPTGHMGRTKPAPFPAKGPLQLQDHGNPVRFRNIWYRELPPRSIEGGTDGYLTTEATMAKRKEIAASIREDAAKISVENKALSRMYRLLESLVYEENQAALEEAQSIANKYLQEVKALPADKLAGKKEEVRQMRDTFKYLARWKRIPAGFEPQKVVEQLIAEQGWDKKK